MNGVLNTVLIILEHNFRFRMREREREREIYGFINETECR
jgi:hypothetical protein